MERVKPFFYFSSIARQWVVTWPTGCRRSKAEWAACKAWLAHMNGGVSTWDLRA